MRILFFVALVNTLIKLSCESFVFPAANTASNRILGFILAYNMDHIDPLLLIFNEYLAMCESGWKPTLVIFTTMPWGDPIRRYIKTKTFCYSINASYPISFSVHAPIISTGLGAVHRQVLGEEVHNYDMFVYHEDDIVFKHAHLIAYIEETKKIHTLFPENGLWDYNIGFQRYRKLFRGGDVHAGNFGEADILEQELLEEVPNFVPICLADHPYIKVDGNTHQAIWALTRDQVLLLQQKCSFMNQSSPSREHMSSLSLFERRGGYCGLTKILPPAGLAKFTILHYYQQRHVSWVPVVSAHENVLAGYYWGSRDPKYPVDFPPCWASLVNQSRIDQNISVAADHPQ